MEPGREPASPCIGVCRLGNDGLCIGCGRDVREIAEWPHASAERKQAIIEAARRRRPGPSAGATGP